MLTEGFLEIISELKQMLEKSQKGEKKTYITRRPINE
jgi:hypothetical protein